MVRFVSNTATFNENVSLRSPQTLMYLFFIPGLLLAGGAFVIQLSGTDLSVAREAGAGSVLSQIVLGLFYFVATIILLRTQKSLKLLFSVWPILVVPILAFTSAAWSDDPSLTLRRAFALTGTILFGLSFASVFSFRTCIIIVVRVLTLAMALSIIWVLMFPQYGIHQATDASQNIHAGLWRGIFAHRNQLGGQWGSITFALLMVYGRYAFKNAALWIGGIIVTVICLVGANSGTGYTLAVALTLVAFSLSFIGAQPSKLRYVLIFYYLFAVFLLYIFADEIFALILWSVGKSSDLTGRTVVWHYMTQLIDSNLLLGRGYYVGILTIDKMLEAFKNVAFGSAHNGYVEILVYFGYIGLTICLMVLAWITWRAIRLVLTGPSDQALLNTFPICVVAYTLAFNLVESGLMVPTCVPTLLLAIASGMLVQPNAVGNHRINLRHRVQ